MNEERKQTDNQEQQSSQDSVHTDPAAECKGSIHENLHNYIRDIEEKLASTRTMQEVIKAIKEVLCSDNAPPIAGLIATQIAKAKEAESQARKESAKSYATASNFSNAVFVASLVLCLTFLGWVIHTLKGDKELLLPVLSAVISLIAGAGGGYVFGRQSVPRQ